jgi:hypothetical protein
VIDDAILKHHIVQLNDCGDFVLPEQHDLLHDALHHVDHVELHEAVIDDTILKYHIVQLDDCDDALLPEQHNLLKAVALAEESYLESHLRTRD